MAPVLRRDGISAPTLWPRSLFTSSSPPLDPRSPAPLPSANSLLSAPVISLRSLAATLLPRQNQIVAIPATYNTSNSPDPGTVAGIVLGSVGGTLLVLWLLYTCFNMGGGAKVVAEDIEVVRRRSRSPARRPSRRSVSETIEVQRRSRTPPPRRQRETVTIIEESRRRSPAPAPVVEEGEDIVEVIEEHSPPPRRSRRVSSGYRTVDPEEFGGGDRHRRPVRH